MHAPQPLPVTAFVILAAAGVLLGYDCWLYAVGGAAATISWHMYLAARTEPIVPFVLGLILGLLFGHLYWPNCGQ